MIARKWIAALPAALALVPMAAPAAEVDTQFIFGSAKRRSSRRPSAGSGAIEVDVQFLT
jgi:hypothetical protein